MQFGSSPTDAFDPEAQGAIISYRYKCQMQTDVRNPPSAFLKVNVPRCRYFRSEIGGDSSG